MGTCLLLFRVIIMSSNEKEIIFMFYTSEEIKDRYGDYVTEYVDINLYFLRKELNENYEHFMDLHRKALAEEDPERKDDYYSEMTTILWSLKDSVDLLEDLTEYEQSNKK